MHVVVRWLALIFLVGLLAGSASALFLISLQLVTTIRDNNPWIIGSLPLAGFIIGYLYYKAGRHVEGGTSMLVDEIHSPKKIILFRMSPLILGSTLATHLFGGSAGREGTAIQMGGSLADQLSIPFKLSHDDRRIIISAGISAGFGSVFGTPLAGFIFAMEIIKSSGLRMKALVPCLLASLLANEVCLSFGAQHAHFPIGIVPEINWTHLALTLTAGAIFGLTAQAFVRLTHWIQEIFTWSVSYPPLRPVIGGVLVVLAIWALGSTRFVGIGTNVIESTFYQSVGHFDFLAKLGFTAITLGSGFKGGEVTPLFFIGSTLGNTLSSWINLPQALLSGMGLVAVFAGAGKIPFACGMMALELFGPTAAIYCFLASFVSSIFSGPRGLYTYNLESLK